MTDLQRAISGLRTVCVELAAERLKLEPKLAPFIDTNAADAKEQDIKDVDEWTDRIERLEALAYAAHEAIEALEQAEINLWCQRAS